MSVDKYLNKVYDKRAYNCAHFVAEVWSDMFDYDLSIALTGFMRPRKERHVSIKDLRCFKRIDAPESPCIVLLQNYKEPPHVGIYLRGRVLHIQQSGVNFELLETVSVPFKKVSFYHVKQTCDSGEPI